MNQVATLQTTQNLAGLYSISTNTAPNIARARINRDGSTEVDKKLVSVPAPSICLKDTNDQEYYATEVFIRVYRDTMQTMVFDSLKEEYTNMSKHFNQFSETAIDWLGGDKCGWIPNRAREKLRNEDPIAFANASKVKLYRHLYGTIRMEKAINPATGSEQEIVDMPFRMRLGGSNFKDIGDTISGIMRQDINPAAVELKLDYVPQSRGSNKWFTLSYKPLMANVIQLDSDYEILKQDFEQLIDYENSQVENKMRESNTSVIEEFDDILEA